MADSNANVEETAQDLRLPRRSRGKLLLASGSLAMIILLCYAAYEVRSHSRYQVIGKTDPATGYRIEYTVSSRYRTTEDVQLLNELHLLDANTLSPPPPPAALQWIYSHILHRYPKGGIGSKAGEIDQVTSTITAQQLADADSQSHLQVPGVPHFEQKMVVSGNPAFSFLTNNRDPNNPTHFIRYRLLCIGSRDRRVQYTFEGYEDLQDPTGVFNEMQKIQNSIRIVKVK